MSESTPGAHTVSSSRTSAAGARMAGNSTETPQRCYDAVERLPEGQNSDVPEVETSVRIRQNSQVASVSRDHSSTDICFFKKRTRNLATLSGLGAAKQQRPGRLTQERDRCYTMSQALKG